MRCAGEMPAGANRPHPPRSQRDHRPHPRLHRDPRRTFTTRPKPTTSIPPHQPPPPCPPPAPSPQPGPTHRTHREAAKHRAPPHPHSARVKITTRAPIPTTSRHLSRVATHPAAAARRIQGKHRSPRQARALGNPSAAPPPPPPPTPCHQPTFKIRKSPPRPHRNASKNQPTPRHTYQPYGTLTSKAVHTHPH